MVSVIEKFATLATDNAPGQEVRQNAGNIRDLMRGDEMSGRLVDFSHGDVDAFTPTPGSFERLSEAVQTGGRQAYTEYRGSSDIRAELAGRLEAFTGASVSAEEGIILTPGTQGALFLAVASTITDDDKVAIVQPDYFANRKLVQFFGGQVMPVAMNYMNSTAEAGLDISQLRAAFEAGPRFFCFPTRTTRPEPSIPKPRLIRSLNWPRNSTSRLLPISFIPGCAMTVNPTRTSGLAVCRPKSADHHGAVENGVTERLSSRSGIWLSNDHRENGEATGHRIATRGRLQPSGIQDLVQ